MNVWSDGDSTAVVSVIMPAYNAVDTIGRSMSSALAQSHRHLELIVIDDCSRDGTWGVVQSLAASDSRVLPVRMKVNSGVAEARNSGIDAASGTHVAFLDSDDCWHPRKLEIQLQALRDHDAMVAYAAYQRVDGKGTVLSTVRPLGTVGYHEMLKSNWIGNLTGIYDRRIGDSRFKRVGHEDYAFWLDLVRRSGRAVCAGGGEPLASYLVRGGSLSSDKIKAARWQWNIYSRVERLGFVRSAWYFCHYAANSLKKRV